MYLLNYLTNTYYYVIYTFIICLYLQFESNDISSLLKSVEFRHFKITCFNLHRNADL